MPAFDVPRESAGVAAFARFSVDSGTPVASRVQPEKGNRFARFTVSTWREFVATGS